jgi:spore coat polysaccharide biosynthesis protein SpsF
MEDPKIVMITQARVGSSRLPSKVLLDLNGVSLLKFHLRRLKQVKLANKLVVATTHEQGVEKIIEIAHGTDVSFYQGSTDDVLDRFYQAAKESQADIVLRLTSDCPLIDPQLVDKVTAFMLAGNYDYCSNILKEEFPDGQDIEVMTFKALEKAWTEATLKSDREHVTPYIRRNSSFMGGSLFKSDNYSAPENMNHIRMTVDEQKDLDAMVTLIKEVGENESWLTYARYLMDHPEKFGNQFIIRNEGFQKSLEKDINN